MYNMPEPAEDEDDGVGTCLVTFDKCMPDAHHWEALEWEQLRLGTYSQDQERPRPIRVHYILVTDKHAFLKNVKHLKQVSVRNDNDLTRLQQKQRQDMAAAFDTLKSKGHKLFYRGSSLEFRIRHADKICTRKRHGATGAPHVQI